MTTTTFTDGLIDLSAAMGSDTLPSFDGVIGEWWFGDSDAASRMNLITGANATMIGAPTYNKGYATMSYAANSGMTLDVGLPFAASIVMLARVVSGQPIMASPGNLSDYNVIGVDTTHISVGQNQNRPSGGQPQITSPDASRFSLFMGVLLPRQQARIFGIDPVNGIVMADGTYGGSMRADRDGSLIKLGGQVNSQFSGVFDLAAMHVTKDWRDAAWLQAIAPRYKARAVSRGVPVNWD